MGALPAVYYSLGGGIVSPLVFLVGNCISAGFATALIPDIAYRFWEDSAVTKAGKEARKVAEVAQRTTGKEVAVRAQRSLIRRIIFGFYTSLPVLLILAMVAFYCVGIFALNKLNEGSTAWKVAVSVFALIVKMVGNKLQVRLINLTNPHSFIADIMLFAYEISTSMLCRLLQLSIPSQTAAQLLSLSSAIVEMGTRVFFYNLYLKAGMKAGYMDKDQLQQYKKRGFMRVQDGSNDMVVEYLSGFIAVFILLWLSPTGAFDFSGQAVRSKQVLAVSFFQLAPEVFLDFYCTYIEVSGGSQRFTRSTGKSLQIKGTFRTFKRGTS